MADRTANEDFGGTTMSRDEEIIVRCFGHQTYHKECEDCNHVKWVIRRTRRSTLEEVQREMRLLITKWRNDPSEGKFSKEMETFNTYLGFIIQKVNERIEELKQRGVKT